MKTFIRTVKPIQLYVITIFTLYENNTAIILNVVKVTNTNYIVLNFARNGNQPSPLNCMQNIICSEP